MMRTPALLKGAALVADIRRAEIPWGRVGVWWLGQATFCFKFGKTIVYTDPFYRAEDHALQTLSETPLQPDEFVDAAALLCTHEHLDHFDPETLPGAAQASADAKIVLPNWIAEMVAESSVPRSRMRPMKGGDSIMLGDLKISAIPTAHMTLDHDAVRGYRYLGYVLEGNGVRIYHTGDVQPYPGWFERVKMFEPLDAVFLPISAVDNLHYTQAVYFCALHRPKLAVPMHYNMFAKYTEDPSKFVEALARNCPEQKARVMTLGEGWMV